MKLSTKILFMVVLLLLLWPVRESQAKAPGNPPAFYGGDFGFYKSLLYGDNVLAPPFFQDRRDGVVTMSNSGVFSYAQVDILKITGGVSIKGPAPKFQVYLWFTDQTDPTKHKFFSLGQTDLQDNLYVPITASVPLYQIGYNYTFQIIVHQELTTNALASQFQLLFEGVNLTSLPHP